LKWRLPDFAFFPVFQPRVVCQSFDEDQAGGIGLESDGVRRGGRDLKLESIDLSAL
jgi:hypothetical protein